MSVQGLFAISSIVFTDNLSPRSTADESAYRRLFGGFQPDGYLTDYVGTLSAQDDADRDCIYSCWVRSVSGLLSLFPGGLVASRSNEAARQFFQSWKSEILRIYGVLGGGSGPLITILWHWSVLEDALFWIEMYSVALTKWLIGGVLYRSRVGLDADSQY